MRSMYMIDSSLLAVEDVSSACGHSPPSVLLSSSNSYIVHSSLRALPCWMDGSFAIQLRVNHGQQINVSVVDFELDHRPCVHYGFILEGRTGQRAEICGGNGEQLVIMSNSEMVEVHFERKDSQNFMLHYQGVCHIH